MKYRFKKSAVGSHNLGYLAGEVAALPEKLAKKLLDDGIVEEVHSEKPKRLKSKKVETAISKKQIFKR